MSPVRSKFLCIDSIFKVTFQKELSPAMGVRLAIIYGTQLHRVLSVSNMILLSKLYPNQIIGFFLICSQLLMNSEDKVRSRIERVFGRSRKRILRASKKC